MTDRGLKAYLPIETQCNRDPFAYKAEQIPQKALQEPLLGFNKATKANWLYTGAQLPERDRSGRKMRTTLCKLELL